MADQLSHGFRFGFSLNYLGPRGPVSCKNRVSTLDHKDQLLAKINKEIYLGRILGPFNVPSFQNFRCSPKGLVPKIREGWRLITNLSAPQGKSINEFINPKIYSIHQLLPTRPEDFTLLGFKFLDKYYVDKWLSMILTDNHLLGGGGVLLSPGPSAQIWFVEMQPKTYKW